MLLPITSIYVFVFAFLFVMLSYNVIKLRQEHGVGLGDGGHNALTRAIAAHGNFAQYVPMMLIILALCEMGGVESTLCFLLGFLMLFARGCHFYSLLVYETNAEEGKDALRFRKTGMVATFASIILGAIFLLVFTYNG